MNRQLGRPDPPRRLLARLLDAPHLAATVQRLDPKLLYRLVRHCGLADCGEILALATTEQLTRIFDDDLWTSAQAGADEELDADRFALWLEVLAELGPEVAARKLVDMDFDLVTAAISRLVLAFDEDLAIVRSAAAEPGSEWEDVDVDALAAGALAGNCSHELGGYTIVARHAGSWDALVSVLASLDHDHRPFFARLMRRCARLSSEYIVDNGGLYEVLTSAEQVVADAAASREDRREAEGYVTASQATAFLKLARAPQAQDAAGVDAVTLGYFRELQARARKRGEPASPAPRVLPVGDIEPDVREFLASVEEYAEPRSPRALLPPAGDDERLSRVRRHLLRLQEQDPAAYAGCTEELAYLANVLLSGCSFQSRRFRPVEAADAALAVCNLGLASGADHQSLVGCFCRGFRILYEEVCLPTARRLSQTLSAVICADTVIEREARETARRLRRDIEQGEPWRSRDEIEVVAMLDQPTWAVLVNLLDQCPTLPRGFERGPGDEPCLRISTEFEFISEARQIAALRGFVAGLATALQPSP
jgi:hypothetical protein